MPVLRYDMKEFYRRNLPHYQPKDAVLFMTVRLYGSIPKEKIIALKDARDLEIQRLKQLGLSKEELEKALSKNQELYFGKFDDLLDNATTGAMWLKEERFAEIWWNALKHFDGDRYKLICSTIMSNHVHFIFYKLDRSLAQIMKSLKGYSGFEINKILVEEVENREKGTSFWQSESYDRSIRNRPKLYEKIRYVLNNPVKAGLVQHWTAWKWNYIAPQFLYVMQ